jgi:hypothetical protein
MALMCTAIETIVIARLFWLHGLNALLEKFFFKKKKKKYANGSTFAEACLLCSLMGFCQMLSSVVFVMH